MTSQKIKVLIVDDESDARLLACEILKNQFALEQAESTQSALDKITQWEPDLVVTDIKMPGEGGLVLLDRINQRWPHLPVILVTGHGDKDLAIGAIRGGAFDFLEKPFEDEELQATVERAANTVVLKAKLFEAQARATEAEKLATVGLMAGGIAHEINTPLGIILLNTGEIKSMLPPSKLDLDKLLEATNTIESTVTRISRIIRSLQSFARESKGAPFVDVKLKDLVQSVLNLCAKNFNENGINLIVDYSSVDHLMIQCRESEIAQVLFNVIHNAKDAVESLGDKWIKLSGKDVNGQVQLIVADSGTGIPVEIRNKIFQPFFTTKEVGKGTGLGLSVSIGLIQNHNGKIYIDDAQKNTTFVIELPKIQTLTLKEKKVA